MLSTRERIRAAAGAKWFDKIDPNKKYADDRFLSGTLNVLYSPKDYFISVTWHQVFVIKAEDLRQNYLRVAENE